MVSVASGSGAGAQDGHGDRNGDGDGHGDRALRQRLGVSIKGALRELSIHFNLLNHQIGANLDLKHVDINCLALVTQHGPLSPTALARRAGLHPATMTGVLDRLERGGWVARDRDPADRRALLVRALPERAVEVARLYGGMNASMDEICSGYADAELALLADFLQRTAAAGRSATEELTGP